MTATIVVDASVLVKRLLEEPDSQAVRSWFNANVGARFVGPSLLFSETGRILQKALPGMDPKQLRRMHARLMGGIVLLPPDANIWNSIDGLTFYDAHYVQLARDLDATLATSDARMRRSALRAKIPLAPA